MDRSQTWGRECATLLHTGKLLRLMCKNLNVMCQKVSDQQWTGWVLNMEFFRKPGSLFLVMPDIVYRASIPIRHA